MINNEANLNDEQKKLKSDIVQTKAAIKEKSRELYIELQDTAESANSSVRDKIEETKQLFNITNYVKIDKYPWIWLGGAVLTGLLLSKAGSKKDNNTYRTANGSGLNHGRQEQDTNIFSELKNKITSELFNLGKTAFSTFSQELSSATNSAVKGGVSATVAKARSLTGGKSQQPSG